MSGTGLRAMLRTIGLDRASNRNRHLSHRCYQCQAEDAAARFLSVDDRAGAVRSWLGDLERQAVTPPPLTSIRLPRPTPAPIRSIGDDE